MTKPTPQQNALIDTALLEPTPENRQLLLRQATAIGVTRVVEQIRRRATRLVKRHHLAPEPLLQRRNELILAVYAAAAPKGWSCGWADGASFKRNGQRQAGIGGLVSDSDGAIIARLSQPLGAHDAFTAELAAVTAVVQIAMRHGQRRLWLYSDNRGLVQLWNEHREDPRLDGLQRLASGLERFALRALPRLHNLPANALARAAVLNSKGSA